MPEPAVPEEVAENELTVSPLELFFDLVFVFAITQVASLLRADHTLAGFAYRVARRLPIECLAAAAAIALVALLGGSLAARTLLVIVALILVVALFVETVRWKQANPEKYAGLH